jgi:hypothetical protein
MSRASAGTLPPSDRDPSDRGVWAIAVAKSSSPKAGDAPRSLYIEKRTHQLLRVQHGASGVRCSDHLDHPAIRKSSLELR